MNNELLKQALEKCERLVIESGAHESYKAVRDAFEELRVALQERDAEIVCRTDIEATLIERANKATRKLEAQRRVLEQIKSQEPVDQKRKDAMALYTPPFRFDHGYIYDSKSHMVADQGGCNERDKAQDMMVAQIRDWGRIGYMPNAAELQDEAGHMLVDALNAYYIAPGAQPVPEGWQPIATAPKDNQRPLLIANFYANGTLREIDHNASWEKQQDGRELPEYYWVWESENWRVEEPTHWMYQPDWYAMLEAAKGETK